MTFNRFGLLRTRMRANAAVTVNKTTHDIAGDAAVGALVDTGALRASYRAKVDGLEGIAYTDKEYAPHQEFGTVYQSGKPHLIPAAERNRGPFEAAMKKLFR